MIVRLVQCPRYFAESMTVGEQFATPLTDDLRRDCRCGPFLSSDADRDETPVVEIGFLWVGKETKTGDAIGCRFTDPATGRNVVVLIDGGFTETGDRVVEHVQN